MKDRAVPVLAAILVALLASAWIGGDAALVPSALPAVASAMLVVVAAFVAVVVPATRTARPAHVLAAVLVALPAAAALHRAAGPLDVPVAFVVVAVAAGLAATAVGPRARAAIVTAATLGLGGGAALDAADVVAVPATLRAPTSPLRERSAAEDLPAAGAAAGVPTTWTSPPGPGAARRVGRFARAPRLDAWPASAPPGAAATWIPVPEGAVADVPRGGPAVLLLGVFDAPGVHGASSVRVAPVDVADARDLDPFDVVVLGGGDDDARRADAVAGFARRGGLVVGPPAGRPWPTALARRLGPDAPSSAGVAGTVGFGAGHLARADALRDVAHLIAAGLARPRLFTAFDGATSPPPAPRGARRFVLDGGPVRDLVGFTAVATALLGLVAAWLRRRRLVALVVLSTLATLEVAILPVPPSAPAVETVVLETGGAGGRRVEASYVAAGPRGWVGPAGPGLASPDAVRTLGFRVVRDAEGLRLALAPYGEGWIVVERPGRGDTTGLAATDEIPAWAMPLLGRTGRDAIGGRAFAGDATADGGAGGAPWPGLPPPARVRTLLLRPR